MSNEKMLSIIVATDENGGISKHDTIPWPNGDLQYFKNITTQTIDPEKKNCVIMGRKTFESIGKELANRLNLVASRSGCSLDDLIKIAEMNDQIETIFIIGGSEIYSEIFKNYYHRIYNIYWTRINGNFDCDKFFDCRGRETDLKLIYSMPFEFGSYNIYRPINRDEEQYLTLLKDILENGSERTDRTGVGTISKFGVRMEFDISKSFPIITTRQISWKTILKELLWFISGSTDSTILEEKGVKIWLGNTSREFLDNRGLNNLPVGDIGAGYGHCWRHWGAEYSTCKKDYTGKGIDQLKNVINLIKTDPTSRRIIMSAWNPSETNNIALPPCHILCQWYVNNGTLDCQLYQRSGDMALGIPFNITSYSFLTFIIAKICNLQPGRFIHVIGDAHIYKNHYNGIQEQITRHPFQFPELIFNTEITDIDSISEKDFSIKRYNSHAPIKMQMAT
jgi:dihydrofolate reductase / thymidylate synthase